ncbi:MAG: sigma-70 family RNA polymerase sigma factor [Planctomycetota bacterium]
MNGDDSEFGKIHDTFRPKVLRYLTRLVGEYYAEDLTQDVFVKINRARKDFRGKSKLAPWIYRIATNTALDKMRSPSFRKTVQKSCNDIVGENEEHNHILTDKKTLSAEQHLIRKEMNHCIRDFVEKLPNDYRTIVVLSELEGLKNNQIAEILKINLDTVKIRLHRAREKLKQELESHCVFYRDERNELACDLKSALKEFKELD